MSGVSAAAPGSALLSIASVFLATFFLLIFGNVFSFWSFGLWTFFTPGPIRASTTCAQSFSVSSGRFFHLFTMRTQALQTSPARTSDSLKQSGKCSSYFLLLVNLELENHISFYFSTFLFWFLPAWLCSANTTSIVWPVQLRFMKGCHFVAENKHFSFLLMQKSSCTVTSTVTCEQEVRVSKTNFTSQPSR